MRTANCLRILGSMVAASVLGPMSSAAELLSACRLDGFYVSTDFRNAFVVRHSGAMLNWPMERLGSYPGIESALRPEAAQLGVPLRDCSTSQFSCVAADALPLVYALPRSRKVGDKANVGGFTFRIAHTYESPELEAQIWVDFAATNGDVAGTFIYTPRRGVVGITERLRDGAPVTLVLVQGQGLLTQGCRSTK